MKKNEEVQREGGPGVEAVTSRTAAENESRAQHTPGPWRWDRGLDDDETRCFVTQAVSGQAHYVIAEIQNGAPGDCLETEVANARLVAAAPDLLAALKECRDAVTAAMRVVADLDAMRLLGADADTRQARFVDELKVAGVKDGFGVRANAAIAKAEGR